MKRITSSLLVLLAMYSHAQESSAVLDYTLAGTESAMSNGIGSATSQDAYEFRYQLSQWQFANGYVLANISMPIRGDYRHSISKVTVAGSNLLQLSNGSTAQSLTYPASAGSLYLVVRVSGLLTDTATTRLFVSDTSFEQAVASSSVSLDTALPTNKKWQFANYQIVESFTDVKTSAGYLAGNSWVYAGTANTGNSAVSSNSLPTGIAVSVSTANQLLISNTTGAAATLGFRIYTMQGTQVLEKTAQSYSTGTTAGSLALPAGLYVLHTLYQNNTYSQTIIIN